MEAAQEADTREEESFPIRERQGWLRSRCYGPFSPTTRVGKALPVKAQVSQARRLRTQSTSGKEELSFQWGVQFSEGQIRGPDKASLDVLITKGGLNSWGRGWAEPEQREAETRWGASETTQWVSELSLILSKLYTLSTRHVLAHQALPASGPWHRLFLAPGASHPLHSLCPSISAYITSSDKPLAGCSWGLYLQACPFPHFLAIAFYLVI